ncbi:MAG: hypothetical protein M5U32_12700 [Myxococcota bacterium]|nr:hypothetical protein [Myxococcota bacterium]
MDHRVEARARSRVAEHEIPEALAIQGAIGADHVVAEGGRQLVEKR